MEPLKWADVVENPDYQALPPKEKYQAQIQYFRDVVAPQVPRDQLGKARNQFFSEYKPEIYQQQDVTKDMSDYEKFKSGAGKAVYDLGRGVGQVTGYLDQNDIDEAKKLDAPLMKTGAGTWGNVAGNVMASIPAAFIPGANTALGTTLVGGGMGLLQPTATGESRLMNTAMGAGSSLASYGIGKGANKAVDWAGKKIANIESSVAAKAAADAAAETASARSAAGNAAQNAYRQLEHLRDLKAMGMLTPEQSAIASGLEKELASKAAEKLAPAAAQKAATAEAFKTAIETEPQRAAELFSQKLGGSEIKNQIMARVKRYGPAVVGGMIGNAIFPGLGGAVGGAATGLTLRPAIRSVFNLAKNPAVQRAALSPLASSGLLANPALPQALGLLAPSIYFGNE